MIPLIGLPYLAIGVYVAHRDHRLHREPEDGWLTCAILAVLCGLGWPLWLAIRGAAIIWPKPRRKVRTGEVVKDRPLVPVQPAHAPDLKAPFPE